MRPHQNFCPQDFTNCPLASQINRVLVNKRKNGAHESFEVSIEPNGGVEGGIW
jgi:hypothetical protein